MAKKPALTIKQKDFCLHYLRLSFNATKAYQAAYPKAKATTAADQGYRNLRNPEIRAYLNAALEKHWQGLQMAGDEALARVAMDARADPRQLGDSRGRPLALHEWPDDLANSVESVEFDGQAVKRVRFASKTLARRTILEQTGKLKSVGDSIDALADAIRADLSRGKPT